MSPCNCKTIQNRMHECDFCYAERIYWEDQARWDLEDRLACEELLAKKLLKEILVQLKEAR